MPLSDAIVYHGQEATFVRPDLRCLFMSGYRAEVIAHRGILYQGVQYLQKPFSRQDLADTVRELLDGTGDAVR